MAARGKGPRYYSTTVTTRKRLSTMMELLAEYGAGTYMVEQSEDGPVAVAFQMDGLAFRIQPDVDGLTRRVEKGQERLRTGTTASMVAWAQASELLRLQLEAIASGAGKVSEVLGGYVLTEAGRTVGDMLEERHAELMPGEHLLLPRGR